MTQNKTKKVLCPLYHRIPRELFQNKGKYLGMILILICTISIGSSFQASLDVVFDYLASLKTTGLQEDGHFETAIPLSDEVIDEITKSGITLTENFYITENAYDGRAKLLLYKPREEMNLVTLFYGKLPTTKNEVAIDQTFARSNGLSVGDSIRLCERELTISGTTVFADYSSLFQNNTDLVMNTKDFGVGILTEALFDELSNQNLTYKYSYRLNNQTLTDYEKQEVASKIQQTLLAEGILPSAFLRADQNQCITFLETDLGTDGPMMNFFVYLLITMIAFVFAIMIGNTIDQEAVIIGTLLASGYRKGEIVWHYLQPTIIVSIIGSLLGNLLGYTAMLEPFKDIYYTTYCVAPIHVAFSLPAFLLTTILPVVIMVCVNVWMLVRKLSLSPLKFLRHDLKKGKSKKALHLSEKLSFLHRFRIRVLLQNKFNYLLLFVGIFLSSFLLMFGIGLQPLMDHYTDSVNETLPFEYQYLLKLPMSDRGFYKDNAKTFEEITIAEMKTPFALADKDISVTCYGLFPDSHFFQDVPISDGITVSSALSEKLSLEIGDSLFLMDTFRNKEYHLAIEAIYPYEATLTVFLPQEKLCEMLSYDEGTFNCVLSDAKLPLDDSLVLKQISRSDLLGAARQMMDSFATVISFVKYFSIAVYMILMYILTKTMIEKNALAISFLKVFGYEKQEISKLYLRATTITVFSSLLLCIPLELVTFKMAMQLISSMIEGYLAFYVEPQTIIAVVMIGVFAYYIINALHIRHVKRIPLSLALKSRE